MRTLGPAPASVLDPSTGARRVLREKRWLYGALSTPELFIGYCVVDLGYAVTAFAYAFDIPSARLVVDRRVLVPPGLGEVRQTERLQYAARCDHPAGVFRVERWRDCAQMTVDVAVPGLAVHASIGCDVPAPSVTAIVPITGPGGAIDVTEKRALLPVRGPAALEGRRRALDGGLAGYDCGDGILASRTACRWGLHLGRTTDATPVALNLVQGFVGEAECALWLGDEVYPLGEGHIEPDPAGPLAPWRVASADGRVALVMEPVGAHTEAMNLGVIASRFVHPVGLYRGAVKLPGRADLVLDGVAGVTEDQDVRW